MQNKGESSLSIHQTILMKDHFMGTATFFEIPKITEKRVPLNKMLEFIYFLFIYLFIYLFIIYLFFKFRYLSWQDINVAAGLHNLTGYMMYSDAKPVYFFELFDAQPVYFFQAIYSSST